MLKLFLWFFTDVPLLVYFKWDFYLSSEKPHSHAKMQAAATGCVHILWYLHKQSEAGAKEFCTHMYPQQVGYAPPWLLQLSCANWGHDWWIFSIRSENCGIYYKYYKIHEAPEHSLFWALLSPQQGACTCLRRSFLDKQVRLKAASVPAGVPTLAQGERTRSWRFQTANKHA